MGSQPEEAQRKLEQAMAGFEKDLQEEIFTQAPSFLKPLVLDQSAIKVEKTVDGYRLILHNTDGIGQILAIWELGIPHGFSIDPSTKTVLKFKGDNKEDVFAAHVNREPVPAERFIRKAWKLVTDRYRQRVIKFLQGRGNW